LKLKVPFAEITCCGGVGLLRTGAPPAFANAQTGSTTGTAEGTARNWSHLQEGRGKLCQHHAGQHRQRLSAGQRRGLLGPSDGPHATASQALTPQEAHGRRSSNGRQGAGQPVRPPGTEHPPRAILAAHDVKHLDLLVDRSSRGVELLLQLPKRVPAPSFSTGLALSSVDSLRRQGTQGTR
jgi:hypothetical protein